MEWWVDGVGDALIEMKAPRCGGWGVRHLKPEGIPFWNGIQPLLDGGNTDEGLLTEPPSLEQMACSLPLRSQSPVRPQATQRAETENPCASQHSGRKISPPHTAQQNQTVPPSIRAAD